MTCSISGPGGRARFALRGFHDAVLKGGVMPLEVLEQVVNDWVMGS